MEVLNLEIPDVMIDDYLQVRGNRTLPDKIQKDCERVAHAEADIGMLQIGYRGLDFEKIRKGQEMGCRIFAQPDEALERNIHQALKYEKGISPLYTEFPVDLSGWWKQQIPKESWPVWPVPSGDKKLRIIQMLYHANDGDSEHELQNLTPEVFAIEPTWHQLNMEIGCEIAWVGEIVEEMSAIGHGFVPDLYTRSMKQAKHLIAFNGANLGYGKDPYVEGDVVNGVHVDFNHRTFLTPANTDGFDSGFRSWNHRWQKIKATGVKKNRLITQTGLWKMIVSGGVFRANLHEVICTADILKWAHVRLAHNCNAVRGTYAVWLHADPQTPMGVIPEIANDARFQKQVLKFEHDPLMLPQDIYTRFKNYYEYFLWQLDEIFRASEK